MNVTGWREEPATLQPFAARLTRWLEAATPSPHAGSDEIAAQLTEAWRDLLDARGVSLWTLGENGRLELMSRGGEFDGHVNHNTHTEFSERAWPAHAFWFAQTDGITRDFVTTLGLLSEMTAAPSLGLPLGDCALALFWLDAPDGELDARWQNALEPLAAQSGALLGGAMHAEKIGRSLHQLAQTMGAAIDGRETHREGYSQAVAYYSGLIGRELKLDETELERIEFAALWHGLGRLSVPDAILQKTTRLEPAELEQVRGAATWGADKLESVNGLAKVASIVRHQNEHFDGSGAPEGLAGRAIPVGSRILAVAARFAAMTTPRADRAPMSVVGGAMDAVAASAGTILDPGVVNAFLNAMGRTAQ